MRNPLRLATAAFPVLLALGVHRASAEEPATAWALIAGVNNYQAIEPLEHAVDDAWAVRETLVEQYGFDPRNIVYLADDGQRAFAVDGAPTKANILLALDSLFGQPGVLEEDDLFVFFFSGHGMARMTALGADGYLLPIDARGTEEDVFLTCVPMRDLRKYAVENLAARRGLFLIDACYSGLSGVTPMDARYPRVSGGDGPAKYVISAGKRDEPVIEINVLGHGVFVYSLLEALEPARGDTDGNGALSSRELHGYAAGRIAELLKEYEIEREPQVPQRSAFIEGAGDVELRPVPKGSRPVREQATALLAQRKALLAPATPPPPAQAAAPAPPAAKVPLAALAPRLPRFAVFVTPPSLIEAAEDPDAPVRHRLAEGFLREALMEAGMPVASFGARRPGTVEEARRAALDAGADYLLALETLRPVRTESVTGLSWSAAGTVAGGLVELRGGTELASGSWDIAVDRHATEEQARESAVFLAVATMRDEILGPAAAHFLASAPATAATTRFTVEIEHLARHATPADFSEALKGAMPAGSSVARMDVGTGGVVFEVDVAGDFGALEGAMQEAARRTGFTLEEQAREGSTLLLTARRR